MLPATATSPSLITMPVLPPARHMARMISPTGWDQTPTGCWTELTTVVDLFNGLGKILLRDQVQYWRFMRVVNKQYILCLLGTPMHGGRGEVTYKDSAEYRPIYNHSIPSYSSSFSDSYKAGGGSKEPTQSFYASGLSSNYSRLGYTLQTTDLYFICSNKSLWLEETLKTLLHHITETETFHLENTKLNLLLLLPTKMFMK